MLVSLLCWLFSSCDSHVASQMCWMAWREEGLVSGGSQLSAGQSPTAIQCFPTTHKEEWEGDTAFRLKLMSSPTSNKRLDDWFLDQRSTPTQQSLPLCEYRGFPAQWLSYCSWQVDRKVQGNISTTMTQHNQVCDSKAAPHFYLLSYGVSVHNYSPLSFCFQTEIIHHNSWYWGQLQ